MLLLTCLSENAQGAGMSANREEKLGDVVRSLHPASTEVHNVSHTLKFLKKRSYKNLNKSPKSAVIYITCP